MMLQNKTSLVTGAGSGIGRAIALRQAEAGARVVVSDVDEAGGHQTVEQIRGAGGQAVFFRCDVSVAAECEALVNEAVRAFGALHVAVNNAGVGGPSAPVGEYPIEAWERVIAINLSGVFYGMRFQIPAIQAAGGGSIINITSILGQVGFRGSSAYVSAKHGIIGLTKTAALEYAPAGIRVNAVGPAFINTPLLAQNLDAATLAALAGMHPMGRLGESDEVAHLVVWLSSDRASFVTGSYYAVDGGYLSQ